jgi:hypothetical protein
MKTHEELVEEVEKMKKGIANLLAEELNMDLPIKEEIIFMKRWP